MKQLIVICTIVLLLISGCTSLERRWTFVTGKTMYLCVRSDKDLARFTLAFKNIRENYNPKYKVKVVHFTMFQTCNNQEIIKDFY